MSFIPHTTDSVAVAVVVDQNNQRYKSDVQKHTTSPSVTASCLQAPVISMVIDATRNHARYKMVNGYVWKNLLILLDTQHGKLAIFKVRYLTDNKSYSDSEFEYRHVQLPKNMLKAIPRDYFDPAKGTLKLLWEEEWRGLGITQSLGWEHYEVHEPEPHILLFK